MSERNTPTKGAEMDFLSRLAALRPRLVCGVTLWIAAILPPPDLRRLIPVVILLYRLRERRLPLPARIERRNAQTERTVAAAAIFRNFR